MAKAILDSGRKSSEGKTEADSPVISSAQRKANLYSRLWAAADVGRDYAGMDNSQLKSYLLGTIFYKDLSISVEEQAAEELSLDGISYEDAWAREDYRDAISERLVETLGYVIAPEYLYSSIIEEIAKGSRGNWSTDLLAAAFSQLTESTIGQKSQHDFEGLFSAINLSSTYLGKDVKTRNWVVGELLKEIGKIDFRVAGTDIDLLGDAYEYLIGRFASEAGQKAGQFYTPQEVSALVARLCTAVRPDAKAIYDPTCGSGSLLLRMKREIETRDPDLAKLIVLDGQELNTETYNLARMNLILHGVRWQNFSIENGDTLNEDLHLGKSYDIIGANPPYSVGWRTSGNKEQEKILLSDSRFAAFGKLAPAKTADLAFVQHIVGHLKPNGVAAVILPHGILFRGQSEGYIRQKLVEMNLVDAIIGLPGNLFYGTGIATFIMVLRKDREESAPVRFIDASQEFARRTNQNYLTEDNILKILDAYWGEIVDEDGLIVHGKSIADYSRTVSREEIKANDYSLKVDLYVDATPKVLPPDLDEVRARLAANRKAIDEVLGKIETMALELGEEK